MRPYSNSVQANYHASLVDGMPVINNSWGQCSYPTPSEVIAIKEILDNGTVIVSAAGNGPGHWSYCGGTQTIYPFSTLVDSRIIVVSSTDVNDNHNSVVKGVHNHNPTVDLCAPGYRLTTTSGSQLPWPYYGNSSGTSWASPQVAATAALIKAINPCFTTQEVKDIIKSTTDPINDADQYPGLVGTGRLNMYNAVMQAAELKFQNIIISNALNYNRLFIKAGTNIDDSIPQGPEIINNNAIVSFFTIYGTVLEHEFTVEAGSELIIDTANSLDCY